MNPKVLLLFASIQYLFFSLYGNPIEYWNLLIFFQYASLYTWKCLTLVSTLETNHSVCLGLPEECVYQYLCLLSHIFLCHQQII